MNVERSGYRKHARPRPHRGGGALPGQGLHLPRHRGQGRPTSGLTWTARRTRAARFQSLGLGKGDRVGLIVVEPEDTVLNFFAAIRAGIVPVPLYRSRWVVDAYMDRLAGILTTAEAFT